MAKSIVLCPLKGKLASNCHPVVILRNAIIKTLYIQRKNILLLSWIWLYAWILQDVGCVENFCNCVIFPGLSTLFKRIMHHHEKLNDGIKIFCSPLSGS